MILLLTVASAANETAPTKDLRVSIDRDHLVSDLQSALRIFAGEFGRGQKLYVRRNQWWVLLSPEKTIEESKLTSGERLFTTDDDPNRGQQQDDQRDRPRLLVTSGFDAGRYLVLTEGYHMIGGVEADGLALEDPKLSGHGDFGIDVAPQGELLLDPGPQRTNPLRINGMVIERPTKLHIGDAVRVGTTGLAIRAALPQVDRDLDDYGAVPFNRTPQFREPIQLEEFAALGDIPTRPKPRRFQALATFAPLMTGIAMAVIMGNPRFLLFAVMSPVVGFANRLDAKRTGIAEYEQAAEKLTERIADRRKEVDDALDAERNTRNRNSPDTLELVERADQDDKRIWNRARTSAEFLSLRFGDGVVEPAITIEPEGDGEEELKKQVAKAFDDCDHLIDMPVTVNLAEHPVVALVGDSAETLALATGLLVQASVLHSPEDLVAMVALSEESGAIDWAKWLPHTRSKNSPFADSHLADNPADADRLLQELTRVSELRAMTASDNDYDPRWPRILFVLDGDLRPDPGTLSRLLDLTERSGVSVIYLCDEERSVPRQALAIATLREPGDSTLSEMAFVDPDLPGQSFEPGRLPADVALRASRRLAPLRDTSAAKAAAGVPTTVTLFDALNVDSINPDWIIEQWFTNNGYSIPTRIGLADTGPVTLDLVKHGPHGLIGGTSGAGKSELVQSLVGNLVALNSPERANILFVDYKGGALSGLFEGIPHEVGAVTNLSPLLSLRALTSLRAELDRRMKLFADNGVTDLKGMLEEHPDKAPPSLVIVVDEFATLKRELPEFVEGVVSIAERGRSLGIHLLLSTQRPSGSIDENIQQNTNLRISLRMLDSGESNNVIGTADAATIPNHLKGRGYARLGPGELVAFQSSWSGAPLRPEEGLPPVLMEPFEATDTPLAQPKRPKPPPGDESEKESETQLDALVESIRAAAVKSGAERGRVPWLDTLPELMSLQEVLADERASASKEASNIITFGMKDDPAAQAQYPEHTDMEDGCLVIFGGSSSGKTTTLTTLAAAAAIRDSERGGGNLTIFGFDYASRQLGVINRLPQSLPVADSDNMEAVTRYIAVLEQRFNERQAAVAQAVTNPDQPDPEFLTILVLIDGFEMLGETFSTNMAMQAWLDRLMRICTRGREVAIYSAVTTSSFSGPSGRLANSTSNRMVLKQSDENGYRSFGLRSSIAAGLDLIPGQAMNLNGDLLQVAAVCDPAAEGDEITFDLEAISRLKLDGEVAGECWTEPLPEVHTTLSDTARQKGEVELGIADLTHDPVIVNVLLDGLAVYGPPRSGRSTVLANATEQLSTLNADLWAIGSKASPLQDLSCWAKQYFGRQQGLEDTLKEMLLEYESFPDRLRILVVDDANQVDEMSLNKPLQALFATDIVCIGSALDTRSLAASALHKAIKSSRNLLFLRGEDEQGIQAAAGRAPSHFVRPGLGLAQGSALTIANGIVRYTAVRS